MPGTTSLSTSRSSLIRRFSAVDWMYTIPPSGYPTPEDSGAGAQDGGLSNALPQNWLDGQKGSGDSKAIRYRVVAGGGLALAAGEETEGFSKRSATVADFSLSAPLTHACLSDIGQWGADYPQQAFFIPNQ